MKIVIETLAAPTGRAHIRNDTYSLVYLVYAMHGVCCSIRSSCSKADHFVPPLQVFSFFPTNLIGIRFKEKISDVLPSHP